MLYEMNERIKESLNSWQAYLVIALLWVIAIYIKLYHNTKQAPLDVIALRKKYLSLQPPIERK